MASPQLAAGYRHLLDFTREDLIAIHDGVASLGRTWDIGVRDSGTIDYVVEEFRRRTHRNARTVFGVRTDPEFEGAMRVMTVLTGVSVRRSAPSSAGLPAVA